jgi:hypothetical protein
MRSELRQILPLHINKGASLNLVLSTLGSCPVDTNPAHEKWCVNGISSEKEREEILYPGRVVLR